jgi:hypothetical protein
MKTKTCRIVVLEKLTNPQLAKNFHVLSYPEADKPIRDFRLPPR